MSLRIKQLFRRNKIEKVVKSDLYTFLFKGSPLLPSTNSDILIVLGIKIRTFMIETTI
jgi:hypothetical protein